MTTIPRFMVCSGASESLDEAIYLAMDVPCDCEGNTRKSLMMFSTGAKAREFIASNPGEWHVRCLDAEVLRVFLDDPRNRANFDCVVIDFMHDQTPRVVLCFDAGQEWAVDDQDELPTVKTWQVFI